MTISPVSGSTANSAVQSTEGANGRERWRAVFEAVGDKLGMSRGALQAALGTGKSLIDVAAAKGVDKDELLATIKSALHGNDAQLSDTQLSEMTNRIAGFKGGHHHHHHHDDAATAGVAASTAVPPAASAGTQVDAVA